MITRLYIDSDTCLEFNSRAKAFIYAEKHGLANFMLLTSYDKQPDLKTTFNFSVFNPYLSEKCVEYFETEAQALLYIGNFLN